MIEIPFKLYVSIPNFNQMFIYVYSAFFGIKITIFGVFVHFFWVDKQCIFDYLEGG